MSMESVIRELRRENDRLIVRNHMLEKQLKEAAELNKRQWKRLNEAEPVRHACWIVIDSDSDGDEAFCHCWGTLKCSHCGYERETEDGYMPVYCECCGSKMDEEIEARRK